MAEKRKRCPNFSTEEKDRLVKLLGSHKETILNKRTDGTTNEAKNVAWERITLDFNSAATVFRNKDSLMKLWEKMKSESKRYYHLQRTSTTATGGGPSDVKIDPILEQVCALLGRACTGILGVPDCDSELYTFEVIPIENRCPEICEEQTNGNHSPILPIFEECVVENNNQNDGVNDDLKHKNQEWNKNKTTPKTPLWSRRRPELSRTNERTEAVSSICNSFINVNNKRKDIEALKQEMLEEEINFKRKMYDLQLQAAAKEVEIKTEVLKQIKGGAINMPSVFDVARKNE